VKTPAVVKHLDVVKQFCVGDRARGEGLIQLGLERAEEALAHRVIPAVALTAHAAGDAVLVEQPLEVAAGVLAASVRVVDRPPEISFRPRKVGRKPVGRAQALTQRPSGRLADQVGLHVVGRGPTHNFPAEQVDHDRQVQPALVGVDVGDVADPLLVRTGRGEVARKQVVRDGLGVIAVGGSGLAGAGGFALYIKGFHHLGHRLLADHVAVLLELLVDAWAAVGPPAVGVGPRDLRRQFGATPSTRPGRTQAPNVVVKPVAADPQRRAQRPHRPGVVGLLALLVDEGVPHLHSFAK